LLTILSPIDPVPAPYLSSVDFSADGQSIIISFNVPTDQGKSIGGSKRSLVPSQFPCRNLFLFQSVNDTSCRWVDSSIISLTTSTSPMSFLTIGHTI
jgi:hypothetical protein